MPEMLTARSARHDPATLSIGGFAAAFSFGKAIERRERSIGCCGSSAKPTTSSPRSFPWTVSIVKLPWMAAMMQVEW